MAWSKLKVTDLKAELKRRGLPQSGLKSELVARLEEADAEADAAPAEPSPEVEEPEPSAAPAVDSHVAFPPELPAEPGATATSEELAPEKPVGEVKDVAMDDAEPNLSTDANDAPEPALPEQPTEEPAGEPNEQSAESTAGQPEEQPDESGSQQTSAPKSDLEIPTQVEAVTPPTAAPTENRDEISATNESNAATRTAEEEAIPSVSQDNVQKRKRSPSPTPSPDSTTRKRHRQDSGSKPSAPLETAPVADDGERNIEDQDTTMAGTPSGPSPRPDTVAETEKTSAPDVAERARSPEPSHHHENGAESRHFPGIEVSTRAVPESVQEMDFERDIEPAVHPATTALYIRNFMRPLRGPDVRAHLAFLAAPSGAEPSSGDVVDFFLDQIRTHAFAVFKTVSAASRVRNALHQCVWPDEANRKALWVDFVPPEKVAAWIDTEEAQGGGRSSTAKRWVVNYEVDGSGNMVAHLDEEDAASRIPTGPAMRGPPSVGRAPPPLPNSSSANMIPLGPRGQRIPQGPRGSMEGVPPRGPAGQFSGNFITTTSRPHINYKMVSEDVARRRVDDMRAYYTQDRRRDVGKEINRYSFEDGTRFVDRGKEVFEGIRPPHREREKERERRGWGGGGGGRGRRGGRGGGGRGGPPPSWARSDRYMPSLNERDDRAGFGGGGGGGGGWGYDDGPGGRGFGRRGSDDYERDAGRLHFDDDARDEPRDSHNGGRY